MSTTVISAGGVTLAPETYPHIVRLVPCLSSVPPTRLQAWIATTDSGRAVITVALHLYLCDALPPSANHVPASPLADQSKQVMLSLPGRAARVATLVFASASNISDKILGPAAPPLSASAVVPPPQESEVMTTYRAQKVFAWMATWAGGQLPWPAVEVSDVPETEAKKVLTKQEGELRTANCRVCCLIPFAS